MVVRDHKDPHKDLYDYDLKQHQVIINDWSNMLGEEFYPGKRDTVLAIDSVLINGHGTHYDPLTNTRTFAPIAVMKVPRGKKSRFRVANAGTQSAPMEMCVCVIFVIIRQYKWPKH